MIEILTAHGPFWLFCVGMFLAFIVGLAIGKEFRNDND